MGVVSKVAGVRLQIFVFRPQPPETAVVRKRHTRRRHVFFSLPVASAPAGQTSARTRIRRQDRSPISRLPAETTSDSL
jgi:hypothetical protein